MATYDQTTAECHVYTFKEGLLSKIAHDLKIRAGDLRIDVAPESHAIEATVGASSLQVVCAMKDGTEAPGVLSDKDKRDIQGNIVKDVLHAKKHPTITFASTEVSAVGDDYAISGTLSLHGASKPVRGTARRSGDKLRLELTIHQPDYGIKPYSAMLGTLKVKADVKLEIVVPA